MIKTGVLIMLLGFLQACGGGSNNASVNAPLPLEALQAQASVSQGDIVGVLSDDGSMLRYMGLPYAAPPIGDLRWREPQDANAFTQALDASEPGNACLQASLTSALTQSEDCLYLNVAVAQAKPDNLRPVMVWFHGGGDDNGAGHEAIYDIEKLAKATGHVVVSVNSRLGFLGFMALNELRDEIAQRSTGNYHHLDQVAALKWVQDNIRSFNGDANNVTIFGESAGANGVCRHLASRLSDGLYQRAILQSSTCADALLSSYDASVTQGNDFTQIWGCDGAADKLACLRAIAPEQLRQQIADAGKRGLLDGDLVANERFRPRATIDNHVFNGSTYAGIAAANASVDVIVGVNSNEMSLFLQSAAAGAPANNEADYRAALSALNPVFTGSALDRTVDQLYPCADYAACSDAFSAVLSDYVFVCPSLATANLLSAEGHSVYFYEFAREPNNVLLGLSTGTAGPNAPAFGVPHAAELFYLWDFTVLQAGAAPELTVQAMQAYWGSFAATGSPMSTGNASWPLYSAGAQEYLRIGSAIAARNDLRLEKCSFLDGLL